MAIRNVNNPRPADKRGLGLTFLGMMQRDVSETPMPLDLSEVYQRIEKLEERKPLFKQVVTYDDRKLDELDKKLVELKKEQAQSSEDSECSIDERVELLTIEVARLYTSHKMIRAKIDYLMLPWWKRAYFRIRRLFHV